MISIKKHLFNTIARAFIIWNKHYIRHLIFTYILFCQILLIDQRREKYKQAQIRDNLINTAQP